jgi:hypothetical protein
MTNLYRIAANLKLKGLSRAAQKVLDLAEKRKEREERDRILEEQHQSDWAGIAELASPVVGRKYTVQVQYPSWDESGAPYFDENSVSEYLTMTEDDLLNYQEQEQQGGIKITSVKPLLPRSNRR